MEQIQSLKELTPASKIAEIVSGSQKIYDLLKSIGIDPSIHQDETLQSICKQRKWSEAEILQWLKRRSDSEKRTVKRSNPEEMYLSQYCDYLEEKLEKSTDLLSEINSAFPRVHQIHGNQYPWLKNIQWYFEQFDKAFQKYYIFEKKEFYPLAKQLGNRQSEISNVTITELKQCLHIIGQGQHQIRSLMAAIRIKGNNLESPSGSCSTLRILNQNIVILFESLEKLFRKEQQEILSIINQSTKEKNGYGRDIIQ